MDQTKGWLDFGRLRLELLAVHSSSRLVSKVRMKMKSEKTFKAQSGSVTHKVTKHNRKQWRHSGGGMSYTECCLVGITIITNLQHSTYLLWLLGTNAVY